MHFRVQRFHPLLHRDLNITLDGQRVQDPQFVFPRSQVRAVLQVGPRRIVAVDFQITEKSPEPD